MTMATENEFKALLDENLPGVPDKRKLDVLLAFLEQREDPTMLGDFEQFAAAAFVATPDAGDRAARLPFPKVTESEEDDDEEDWEDDEDDDVEIDGFDDDEDDFDDDEDDDFEEDDFDDEEDDFDDDEYDDDDEDEDDLDED